MTGFGHNRSFPETENPACAGFLNGDFRPVPVLPDNCAERLIDDFTMEGHTYDADDHGYLVLIEPGDADRVLEDLDMPWRLVDVPWEGASMRQGFIYAVYLGTDDLRNGLRDSGRPVGRRTVAGGPGRHPGLIRHPLPSPHPSNPFINTEESRNDQD